MNEVARISKLESAAQTLNECQGCRQLVVDIAAHRVFGLPLDQEPDAQGFVACGRCGEKMQLEATPQEDTRIRELVQSVYGVNRSDRFAPQEDDGDGDGFEDVT